MIYAVDFDGTLCHYTECTWPEIGEPRLGLIEFLKKEQSAGVKLILWTCRCGDALTQAVEWCKQHGLIFDAINENLPEQIAMYGEDPRKICADYYIDDRAWLFPIYLY